VITAGAACASARPARLPVASTPQPASVEPRRSALRVNRSLGRIIAIAASRELAAASLLSRPDDPWPIDQRSGDDPWVQRARCHHAS
jgi:hypothetical protein